MDVGRICSPNVVVAEPLASRSPSRAAQALGNLAEAMCWGHKRELAARKAL